MDYSFYPLYPLQCGLCGADCPKPEKVAILTDWQGKIAGVYPVCLVCPKLGAMVQAANSVQGKPEV